MSHTITAGSERFDLFDYGTSFTVTLRSTGGNSILEFIVSAEADGGSSTQVSSKVSLVCPDGYSPNEFQNWCEFKMIYCAPENMECSCNGMIFYGRRGG